MITIIVPIMEISCNTPNQSVPQTNALHTIHNLWDSDIGRGPKLHILILSYISISLLCIDRVKTLILLHRQPIWPMTDPSWNHASKWNSAFRSSISYFLMLFSHNFLRKPASTETWLITNRISCIHNLNPITTNDIVSSKLLFFFQYLWF